MTRSVGPLLTVDLDALRCNWQRVQARFTGQCVGAVVKHDAYGLGLAHVVPVLAAAGCRYFWVDTPQRGLAVRAALPAHAPHADVLVLYGLAGMSMADHAAHGLVPVLTSLEEVASVRESARLHHTPHRVAIHLDTGLTRLGLQEPDVVALLNHPDWLEGLHITDWVTQLSRFDAPHDPACLRQRARFAQWTARLPAARRCVATSAGVLAEPPLHGDHARVGAALYGIDTSPDHGQQLAVVATLTAPVLQVVAVPADTAVGYGGLFRTPRPSLIATVAAGYGDGLPMPLAQGGQVVLHGHAAPMVGAMAMGLLSVDVTDLPAGAVRPGDAAELYGTHLNLNSVARRAGLSAAAVLVPSASRAERRCTTASVPGVCTASGVLA
ncbi:MAG: alanine racemase [Burkholderiales bacterium]|nr:alanine racemase [Burkholderiales bacterium]